MNLNAAIPVLRKSLNRQFPYIAEALADLPAGRVVDGEVVALDDSGRPDFNLLQNFRAEASRIQRYSLPETTTLQENQPIDVAQKRS